MSNSVPSRIGQVNNAGDPLALFLKKFGGEVLTAFNQSTVTGGKFMERSVSGQKSATFPVVGRIAAPTIHTPGNEILGTNIASNEKIIDIDGLYLEHIFLASIDEMMNHYDVRAPYAQQLGEGLALQKDKNLLQLVVLAARTATPNFTGGDAGSSLINVNYKTDSTTLAGGLFLAAETLDDKHIPDSRYAYMKATQYYLLAQNTTAINQLFGGSGAYSDGRVTRIAGIELVKCKGSIFPATNITGILSKYTVNASTTAALVCHGSAVGTVSLKGVQMETGYDMRRQGTLMLSKMVVGSGVLRPESAVELKTA